MTLAQQAAQRQINTNALLARIADKRETTVIENVVRLSVEAHVSASNVKAAKYITESYSSKMTNAGIN